MVLPRPAGKKEDEEGGEKLRPQAHADKRKAIGRNFLITLKILDEKDMVGDGAVSC